MWAQRSWFAWLAVAPLLSNAVAVVKLVDASVHKLSHAVEASDAVEPSDAQAEHKQRTNKLLHHGKSRKWNTPLRALLEPMRHRHSDSESWFDDCFKDMLWKRPFIDSQLSASTVPAKHGKAESDVNDSYPVKYQPNKKYAPRQPDESEEEEVEEKVRKIERKGIHIFETKSFFDWGLFFAYVLLFLWVYQRFFMGLPSLTKYHGMAILGWITMGLVYNMLVYAKLGAEQGMIWLNGYLLELIFSLENVFVFHVIIESFGTPTRCTQKALFAIVCCQILYELVLYMGLADMICSVGVLPYILGVWLTYLGIHSALESDDHSDFDILETTTVKGIRHIAGDRLVLEYDEDSKFMDSSGEKTKCTMLGLVFLCLLIADFCLEIDVTLTKLEETQDEYLSFTSSAIAGFAVPELFFVARDLFRRFHMLKYGISFVLVFYGVNMIFPEALAIGPLQGCGVIVVVMAGCVVASMVSECCGRKEPVEDSDSGEEALDSGGIPKVSDSGTSGTDTGTVRAPRVANSRPRSPRFQDVEADAGAGPAPAASGSGSDDRSSGSGRSRSSRSKETTPSRRSKGSAVRRSYSFVFDSKKSSRKRSQSGDPTLSPRGGAKTAREAFNTRTFT